MSGEARPALTITDECINCDVCEPECPNGAIFFGAAHYEIDPAKCRRCEGEPEGPTCRLLCPVGCVVERVPAPRG